MSRQEVRGARCAACRHGFRPEQLADGYCGSCLTPPARIPDDPEPTRPSAAPAPRRDPPSPAALDPGLYRAGVPMSRWKQADQQRARLLRQQRWEAAQEAVRRMQRG